MTNRRDFLRQAAAGVAALSLGDYSFAAMPRQSRVIGANDRLRLGVAGVNSRGLALAQGFAKMPLCDVVCICDCELDAMARCQDAVEKVCGTRPRGEQDYRKMLEAKDIDAVAIAMPDHWHATAAIMAMRAGKHVYLEKPTSHNPAENEMLLKAERKYSKSVVTVGTQRRSWPNCVEAIEAVRNGEIGEVRYAKSWYSAARTSIGTGKVVPVPANLNWDFWQGPAKRGPEYKDNLLHYNWHWFWHWGTGEALNNGTHFVDLLRWGLDLRYPTKVASVGGRYYYTDDDWETPDTQMITFQFGDKASFSWEGRSCHRAPVDGSPSGVAFYGDKGLAIYMDGGNTYQIRDGKGTVIKDVKSNLTFTDGDRFNPSQKLDSFHFQNWMDTIRGKATLNATLENGCISTQLVQLGNIAQRVGHSLDIDPETGRIVDDPVAMQFWAREYEPGWGPKI